MNESVIDLGTNFQALQQFSDRRAEIARLAASPSINPGTPKNPPPLWCKEVGSFIRNGERRTS